MRNTQDLHVHEFKPLLTPREVQRQVPLEPSVADCVIESRQIIRNILDRKDPRKLLIVGPCSIHDERAVMEYAQRLLRLRQDVDEKFYIVMRAYFEKPRTHVGWKGFINDPFLDNSFQMNEGLLRGRKLLNSIVSMGLPVATEALDPILPQYLGELISWTAIGARTTESQLHREMASGLSSPVGFKNNTDGNVSVAINAIKSAQNGHHFVGIDHDGRTAIVATSGNRHCHLILRGGGGHPNYDSVHVAQAEQAMIASKLAVNIIVDCSHDNSSKDYLKQPLVFEDCINQIASGNQSIVGMMLESHLHEGKQPITPDMRYGVSVTDGCLSFEQTDALIRSMHRKL